MPISILGMHRSGTSMVARLLYDAGLYLGRPEDMMSATDYDNPEGYWEHVKFVEINDALLEVMGGTWDRPPELEPGWSKRPEVSPLRKPALALIHEMESHGEWGWKDPRTSLTIEFWKDLIPGLRALLCVRNPVEVADSFVRRVATLPSGYVTAEQAIELWLDYYRIPLRDLGGLPKLVTHSSSYYYDPQAELQRVLQFLDIKASESQIESIVRSVKVELNRNVMPMAILSRVGLPQPTRELYCSLLKEGGPVQERLLADEEYQHELLANQFSRLRKEAQTARERLITTVEKTQDEARRQILDVQRDRQRAVENLEEGRRRELEAIKENTRKHIQALHADFDRRLVAHSEAIVGELAQLKSEVLAERQEMHAAKAELAAIKATRGYQMLASWWRFRAKFARIGNLEKRLARLGAKGMTVLRQEGTHALARKAGGYVLRRLGREPLRPLPPVAPGFFAKLETDLSWFAVGSGNVLLLEGWCYHTIHRLREVTLRVGEDRVRVTRHSLPRRDVPGQAGAGSENHGRALSSGFEATLPIRSITEPIELPVRLEAVLQDGTRHAVDFGLLHLQPNLPTLPLALEPPANGPFVVLCMTTYNPRPDLFAKQVRSILGQTHRNWNCIISDDGSDEAHLEMIRDAVSQDPRFVLVAGQENLGVYRNFERCLSFVPSNADYVGLADQDDFWFPDKLASLIAELQDPAVVLAYSDMEVVKEDGEVLSPTFWTSMKNNFEDLELMMLANTITGAASLFRRSILDTVLPFPQKVGDSYHDHWLSSAALAIGDIRYINRPLYQYTQHSGNVIGHKKFREVRRLGPDLRILMGWVRRSARWKARNLQTIWRFAGQRWWLKRMSFWAQVLLARSNAVKLEKRRAVESLAGCNESLAKNLATSYRLSKGSQTGLNLQWYALIGVLAEQRLQEFLLKHGDLVIAYRPKAAATAQSDSDRVLTRAANHVRYIPQKIAPLQLQLSYEAPRRVNVLISIIDFNYFFGGYISVFNLAKRLSQHGYAVRMVITDECKYEPELWSRQIGNYAGLQGFFEEVETAYVFDRRRPLETNPADQFLATSWWTAHIAHQAAHALGQDRFVYLTQDFEPVFYPHDTYYALALESYSFPHFALFSTEFLREYSMNHRIGVFQEGLEAGLDNSVSFQNAISAHPPVLEDMARRDARRLLFYARPEEHAYRNCFQMGALGLNQAIEAGYFRGSWEFHGVGSTSASGVFPLAEGKSLKLMSKMSLDEYYALLPGYDVGLSLMLTPHPSLPPLDMAASGLVTVTNTFENKTTDKLEAISRNIIAVPPTIVGVREGLGLAAARSGDFHLRTKGAELQWARNWNEAFNQEVMRKLTYWLGDAN